MIDPRVEKQMIIVCAWCKRCIGHRLTENGGISHGVCDYCKSRILDEHALKTEKGK